MKKPHKETDRHNDNNNTQYTATATICPLGGSAPGLTLVETDGQVHTFPLFSILFSKNGAPPHLGYNAIVTNAPRNRVVPADGPIAFNGQRKADQNLLCNAMTEPDGMHHIMEVAFITDCKGDEYTIAMVEQFGCRRPRADGFPYFMTYRGDSLPEMPQ